MNSLKQYLFPQEDYEPFRPPARITVMFLLSGCAAAAVVGWLFFNHILAACLLLPAGAWGAWRLGSRKYAARRKQNMTRQLKDYLLSVTSFLRTGYALENAMSRGAEELCGIWGPEAPMVQEAQQMSRQLQLRQTPRQLWNDLAKRCGIPEASELARVLAVAKREGGDYLPVLRTMAETMESRRMVREEIETLLTGQKLEYYIMCLIPLLIIVYLKLAAPELAVQLYRPGGRLLMLLILPVYAAAVLLGNRILEKSYGDS